MSKKLFNIIKIYFFIISFFIILISIFFIPAFSKITITNNSQNELPNHQIITSNDITWPLPGYTRISSYFGYRTAPTVGATSFHGGVDIPAPSGTNIISAISGKITKTGFMGSGGCSVVIQNNCYTVVYHHVSPSYIVKVGDVIKVREDKKDNNAVKVALEKTASRNVPAWMEANKERTEVKVLRLPAREEVDLDVQESLIIELYSKN